MFPRAAQICFQRHTTSRPARRKAVAGFCLPHPADRDWHANQVFKKPVGHGHAEGLYKKLATSPRGIWISRYLFCSESGLRSVSPAGSDRPVVRVCPS